jgi:capsular polysaccharide biosynthesis protein
VLCIGGPHYGEHASGHTLLVQDRFIVPDSYFVRNTVRSLPQDLITSLTTGSPHRLRLKRAAMSVSTRSGLHYFAGCAWEQFGHFVLEGLSRWWLLPRLPQSASEELRFVLYNHRPLKSWQLELLRGLGVEADRLVYLDEPMRFERLIIPSIAYNLHNAASFAQRETWDRIGHALACPDGRERVYISRSRYRATRRLVNESQVEGVFRDHGFAVLHPQELSIREQVAAVRDARLIAGSAGSGMHLSAFARQGARTLIISPRNFTLRDDQLIAHLRRGSIAYVLCAEETGHQSARMADYWVDVDVLEDAIGDCLGAAHPASGRAIDHRTGAA